MTEGMFRPIWRLHRRYPGGRWRYRLADLAFRVALTAMPANSYARQEFAEWRDQWEVRWFQGQ